MFFKRLFAALKSFDWMLFGAVALLVSFGLSAIYSISVSSANPDFLNFKKQIVFALIGLGLLFLISLLDYRIWQDYSYFIYIAVAVTLVAVLFLGKTIRGTTGWFSLMGINFQPVELAKIALIAFLAWFLSKKILEIKQFKNFALSALITGGFFLLVIFQPDFGSAIILFLIWIFMLVFAGAKKQHLLFLAGGLALAALVAWLFLFQTYQRDRILTFFNPALDPYGRGYHVRQAVTAVGAGGLFGRGLGFGSQSQLKFLPAAETDFIFAVIAEELGFLGVILVLFFLGVIFYRLIKAVKSMKDSFAQLFILGVSALFFSQIMINIGMNIGIVPVTGISLPFLSYGGSFLVVCLILIGMVESMIIRNRN
ncbi:MAG: rod shape-determining protein RodA [Patescibacteria group bacterium]|jgi:rod shape determining protein RodA